MSPSVAEIVKAEAGLSGVTREALLGEARDRRVIHARQRAMFVSRRLRPDLSLPQLGRCFGHRHHTTVLHAIRAVEQRAAADLEERRRVAGLLDCFAPAGDGAETPPGEAAA